MALVRRAALLSLFPLLLAGPGLVPAAAGSNPSMTLSTAAVPAAPDYASDAYGDPWDFANPQDLSATAGVSTSGVSNAAYRDGAYNFDASRGAALNLVDTTAGALAYGRDSSLQPLDAGRWTQLSVRMWSSVNVMAQVYWFSCAQSLAYCAGATQFEVSAGWNVYDIPMTNDTGTPAAWAGQITGLRLIPGANGAGSFALDWLRLYTPRTSAQVHLTRTGDTSSATIYADQDRTPGNGNELAVGRGAGASVTANVSALPQGQWNLYAQSSGATTYATGSLAIVGAPAPEVLSPDLAGGADYAQVVRGDRWDYEQSSDVGPTANLGTLHVGGGVLNGRNGGPAINDPQVGLPLASPIDGTRFHRLTLKLSYDGPFGLANSPGGGMVARLVWQVAGAGPNDYQDLNDLIVVPGDQTITVDLATSPAWAVTDEGTTRRIGWTGQQITSLRFDPNEDPSTARTWRVDDISIAEDDHGAGYYDIAFQDKNWKPGTVADVYVGTDQTGLNGTLVAGNVAVQSGRNTVRWSAAGASGTYWVRVVMRDSLSTTTALSSGPVVMAVPPPFGSFESVAPAPGGALVTGWVVDPVAAGGTGQAHVYVDGHPAAAVTATGDRPDVGGAFPAFGSLHGFTTTVTGLAAGQHNVCVYAVRPSTGPNPLLGCRQVSVSDSPIGSLDGVVRAPGGARVRGWALDPSTTASITTHTYVSGQFGGAVVADSPRSDIARAFPGYGDAHGVDGLISSPGGTQTLCLYGLDAVAPGSNALLACRSVFLAVDPFGSLDAVTRSGNTIGVRGWAIDPDSAASGEVHVYVDGAGASILRASTARNDVAAVFPDYAAAGHGFAADGIPVGPGAHRVCAYAINLAGAGSSTTLGCASV